MSEQIPYKIYLSEAEMPTAWYNLRADMKNKPAPLLNPGTGKPMTFDDLRRHLDHFLDLGGEGHLALGADLDGCNVLPEGFAALNDYETLGRYLADAGYPDETIQNLFCNSLMKVVKTCIM